MSRLSIAALTLFALVAKEAIGQTYIQGNFATPQTPQTIVSVTYNGAQVAGDINVVVAGWNDSTAVVASVTDTNGNAYALAVGPTAVPGAASQSIYYARNIAAAPAGGNTVTVRFNPAAPAAFPDIRIVEYGGVDQVNPLDVTATATGNSATSATGPATTSNANDLLVAANLVLTTTTGPGPGFTSRMITTPDGDIVEDRVVSVAGSYSASAPLSSAGPWIMQMVALRVAAPGTAPIISADRRTSWNPGLNAVGGIPNRTAIYTTLSPSGFDDTAAIQAALNTCPADQVVKLNAGTFRVSGEGLAITRSNVVLRGSGPTATFITKTDPTNNFPVIIIGNRWSSDKFFQSINLAADGAKGATSVTLASAPKPPLTVGEIVYLDQLTNPNVTVWSSRSPPGDPSRGWFSRFDRPTAQIMEVASVSGTQVSFTTPIHLPFLIANAAQLSRYGEGSLRPATRWSGIEDLYVEHGSGGDGGGNIHLFVCAYCWVKRVESAHSRGTSLNFDGCFRSEGRDSYIHTSDNPNPGGDGYLLGMNQGSADNLFENNIVWNGNKVIVMRATGGGNVIGYNYMEDGYGQGYPTIVEVGLNAAHMTTPHYELFEGNQSFNFDSDSVWGNSVYITAFKNHLTALRRNAPGLVVSVSDNSNRRAIGLTKWHYWYNFVGNVLGTQGQVLLPGQTQFVYEATPGLGSPSGFDNDAIVPMWKIGYDGENGTVPQDSTVVARMFRHGNYDYVSNNLVWDASNPNHVLPDSLYLSSKPAFFGSYTWPWVDPAGTTKVYRLPAKARYDAGTPFTQPP
jgi:hypothetical protein